MTSLAMNSGYRFESMQWSGMRHLTTLADKGVSVRVLMALAGHSQIATTQRYIDLRPSVVRAAVELV